MRPAAFILLLAIAATTGCRQNYAPPVIAHPPGYLVVEGFVCNDGIDSTVFNISRTVPLSDTSVYTPASNLNVQLEDSTGGVYPLIPQKNGAYSYPPWPFPNVTKYRIHFFEGKNEYASDYFPLVPNPPIDSISWSRSDDPLHLGVTISATTHDPQNNTRYYRWSCEETWKYHVKYYSYIYYDGSRVQALTNNNKYYCWKTDNTTGIALASSTQLSQDVIYQAPLLFIPLNSQKLQIKYSVLVKQYALTKQAYDWWQILRKNTEQIGGIFGVQPSANPGNIHCLTDTNQQVLGFAGGGNIRYQRIFISNDQVQPWDFEDDCAKTTIGAGDIPLYINSGYLLYEKATIGYNASHNYCVDCTLTGSNIQPSFWQ
jgi:hypothetical protein